MEIIFNQHKEESKNLLVHSGDDTSIAIYNEDQLEDRGVMQMSEECVLVLLKETFQYDPYTGLFTRLKDASNTGKKGDIAGNPENTGYVRIRVNGKMFLAHRLAWLYMTGKWPTGVVDHKDRNKSNNSWENLRDVTPAVNIRNAGINKNNKSGTSGVVWCKGSQKWHVTIRVNGKVNSLGRFVDKEDATAVRILAEQEWWGPKDRIWDKLEINPLDTLITP